LVEELEAPGVSRNSASAGEGEVCDTCEKAVAMMVGAAAEATVKVFNRGIFTIPASQSANTRGRGI
jgi:hypothetical protein